MGKIIEFIALFQFRSLQKVYFLMYKWILMLMNYGVGGPKNGEIYFLKKINTYFKEKKKEPIIFDVWANIGQYANDIHTYMPIAKTIYSFEPSQKTFLELEKNTKHISSLHLWNIGFWEKNETLELFYGKENAGWDTTHACASLYSENILDYVTNDIVKENISITTLDDFCSQNNISHIDYLKIDTEGHELACLKWARNMIKNGSIDMIQVEHNRCAIHSRTFFKDYWDMFSESYTIYKELSWNHGLVEIRAYDVYLENFSYMNYVFIKKGIYL